MSDRVPGGSRPGATTPYKAEDNLPLATIADAAPAMLWVCGIDERCTWFNAAWLTFVGRSMDEEIGSGGVAHVHPDDRARRRMTLRTSFEARVPFTIEYHLQRHDGQYRWVLDQGAPLFDPDGAFRGFIGSAVDITDQRQGSRAQAYLAAIVESSDDAIIAKDLNGIIQSCNAGAERLFGYAASELIGRPVRMLIPPERQSEEDEILSRLRRGERIDHFETVRISKAGDRLDISLTVSPVFDDTGTIVGVSKIARDITAQRRVAAELLAQQTWFRITLDSIGDGVLATDVHGDVVFMNPVAEHLTGWQAAAARGRASTEVFNVVNEDTREPIVSPVMEVLETGNVAALANHAVLIAADGTERPIADSAAPIVTDNGSALGAVLVFRDVTERYRAEQDRIAASTERDRLLEAERAARAEAERASRVKDDFVAMVSHELRTPLNAILGWTQLMVQNPQDPAVIDKALGVIARNTRMQAQLISDLLDISRIATGKLALDLQRAELQPIVADAIESIQGEADKKGVKLVLELDGSPGAVDGDPSRLQQIIWNLLSNAIKFTPAGGRVTVRLGARGGLVDLVVSDTGAGIRAEILPHVFERFHQADRSITRRFGGLGLGLAIVKNLVELHGGSVRAESDGEGKGTTFTVTLPNSRALGPEGAESLTVPAWMTEDGTSLDGIRVLLVEDEPDTREFLSRLLERHGAAVQSAKSAAEALAMFAHSRPDMLISDIGLPEVDGYDLIRRIRREHGGGASGVPAIALTAYVRTEDRMLALRAGFQGHLAKPVEPAELIATVATFLGVIANQHRDNRN